MRFLTLGEVVELQQRLLTQAGGASGIRDLGLLESALAQPKATFAGADLHPTLADKAAALGFALVANHAFIDGNKRVGHAAMEVFLVLNGHEVDASVDEQERLMLDVARRVCRPAVARGVRSRTGIAADTQLKNAIGMSLTGGPASRER